VSLDQPQRIRAIREAFARHDVMLAEVGVWNNMLDRDPGRRAANIEANAHALAVADELGTLCCVNIAGSFHTGNKSTTFFDTPLEQLRIYLEAYHDH
jgi:sugar phosphate isomerase/epimerase